MSPSENRVLVVEAQDTKNRLMDSTLQSELYITITLLCYLTLSFKQALERDGWFDGSSIIHKLVEAIPLLLQIQSLLKITLFFYFMLCRKCMAFVFLPVLSKELQDYVALWNSHHIRHMQSAACRSGRPDDIYDMPQHFGMM